MIQVACFYGFHKNLEPAKYSSVLCLINSFRIYGHRAIAAILLQLIPLKSFLVSSIVLGLHGKVLVAGELQGLLL